MKHTPVPMFVLAALVMAGPARADQCEWIEPAIAERAARELDRSPELVQLCEPCGDPAPGAPVTARRVEVRPVEGGLVSVFVDGESVDLAYTYVKTRARQYRNLAALAGCATTGVSPSLRVEPATSAGVLIQADRGEPVAVAPPVVQASPVAHVAPPLVMWIVALVAGVTPVGLLAALALWVAMRRRPLHVPRAARLLPPE